MARLIGPDESVRLVYRTDGLAKAQGYSATVYADAGGTQLADIRDLNGSSISGSALTVDGYSKLPLFQFPDSVDTVYVTVNGGPVVPLYARTDDRLDALSRVTVAGTFQAVVNIDTTPLTKTDVGLGNVDNTSDASKPVSTAAQAALDAKVPTSGGAGFALANGGQVVQSDHRMDVGYSNAAAGAGQELYRADHPSRPGEAVFLFGGLPGTGVVTFMHYDGLGGYFVRLQYLPDGGLAVYNSGSEPAAPADGGVLFVAAGALKYKGSSGTVTTLGPA